MRKPRKRIGNLTGRIINVLPKSYGIKKTAKQLVVTTQKHDPVGRGRKLVYDTGEKLLYGKRGKKR